MFCYTRMPTTNTARATDISPALPRYMTASMSPRLAGYHAAAHVMTVGRYIEASARYAAGVLAEDGDPAAARQAMVNVRNLLETMAQQVDLAIDATK